MSEQTNQDQLSQQVFKLTMTSLKKRGVILTDSELALAILYGRFRSIAYGRATGEMSPEDATKAANKAFKAFREHVSKDELEGF